MKQYQNLLLNVMNNGRDKSDRTGTGTRSVFGTQTRYNLLNELPVVTTKKVALKAVIHELLWIISGSTNINYLKENNVNIWNEWATDEGELGPVYGEMWRNFPSSNSFNVDQLENVIHELKINPNSRRLVVSSWNPDLLPDTHFTPSQNASMNKQALPPCHTMFQLMTTPMTIKERCEYANINYLEKTKSFSKYLDEKSVPKNYLSCQMYQRSGDLFLGVPFNITSYSILTYLIACITKTVPYEFIHTIGDAHIYSNHFDQVKEQLSRECMQPPTLSFSEKSSDYTNIDSFGFEDIIINNYDHHPAIKALVAI
jgi:thymidylate synthase